MAGSRGVLGVTSQDPPTSPSFLTRPSFTIFLVLHACIRLLSGFPSFYKTLTLDPPSKSFLDLPLGVSCTIQGYRQQMLPLLEDEGLTRKSAQLKHWKVSPRHRWDRTRSHLLSIKAAELVTDIQNDRPTEYYNPLRMCWGLKVFMGEGK